MNLLNRNENEMTSDAIGTLEVKNAHAVLEEYMRGKANLDRTIIENEDWFKRKNNRDFRSDRLERLEKGSSAWLFNSIANKHADAMDAYPEPAILARSRDDEDTAKMLSSIVPVIMDNCDFESTYSDAWWDKLKNGSSVYSVMWDRDASDGQGDISIKTVDLLSIYWEPGIQDIQDSRNIFILALSDNDALAAAYPQLEGKLSTTAIDKKKYHYDDTIDTTGKSVVVDWYYKVATQSGTIVHYVKFVNDIVLFASENEAGYENGLYNHGKYPIVMDTLYPVKGNPSGFGIIDICKQAQDYIDRLGTAILVNSEEGARVRYLVKDSAGINEEEFSDINNRIVHCVGSPNEDNYRAIQVPSLNGTYLSVLQDKVNELKETSSNRDFNQGGTTSGVTAAQAIQALQESGNKVSRDVIKSSYRAYSAICTMVIELIRQFYDINRTFRITGDDGQPDYIAFNNSNMQSGTQYIAGMEFKTKEPVFDIIVKAQKSSPYSKLSQNELALQFYSAGFFNPQLADQALLCVDMMDFDGKEKVRESIQNQSTMMQQLQQMTMLAQQASKALAQRGDPRMLQAMQSMGMIGTDGFGSMGRQNVGRQPVPGTVDMEAVNDKSDSI